VYGDAGCGGGPGDSRGRLLGGIAKPTWGLLPWEGEGCGGEKGRGVACGICDCGCAMMRRYDNPKVKVLTCEADTQEDE
jgi:hypothetical protein